MVNSNTIHVKVAYISSSQNELISLELPVNSTAEQAVNKSKILQKCSEINYSNCALGIFGKVVDNKQILKDQDRVEILRPLIIDPKHARRKRAQLQD